MKLLIVVILTVFEVPQNYCNEPCNVPCNEYNALKRPSENLHPDDSGVKLKNIGDENVQRGIISGDLESADKIGEITSLEGRKCGRIISKCVRDSDCCTGYCQTMMGRCLFNPFHHHSTPKCRDIHMQCLYNYQCCSGVCDPVTGLCQHHLVTLHPPLYAIKDLPCSPDMGPCQVNAHCCSKVCDTETGSCKVSTAKKLDAEVIDYPILLNPAFVPPPKQNIVSNPKADGITESEQIVLKEIQKESTLIREGSLIVKHDEAYETSTLKNNNADHSAAQNLREQNSLNEQRGLAHEFGTSSLDQQKNEHGPSSVQKRFKTLSAHNQGKIRGSIYTEQRVTPPLPQENKEGSLLGKRILKTSSSQKQNNIGGSSSSGQSSHQQGIIEEASSSPVSNASPEIDKTTPNSQGNSQEATTERSLNEQQE